MSEIKKKKRSFTRNMKKKFKRGCQEGFELPNEVYTYYFTLYKDLKEVDNEQKGILIRRVLEELIKQNRVTDLASSQLGSRMLEEILQEAPTNYVFSVIDAFSQDLRPIFVDKFSSFVLQMLLKISLQNIQEGAMKKMVNSEAKPVPVDENSKVQFITFLKKVCRFTFNNLEDFIQDKYASHIVRTVLEVSSGVEISGSLKIHNKSNSQLKENELKVSEVPEILTSVWHEILERIEHLPNFHELILVDCVSATLQTALLTLDGRKEPKRIISLASHILEYGFMELESENTDIHPVFNDHSSCRLMEVLVSVVPEKNQELIYNAFFRDHMKNLVNHGIAHHAVDKLIASWKSKELFASVINVLSDLFEDLVSLKILHSVVRSCRRLNTSQQQISRIIFKMCECDIPENNQHRFVGPLLHSLKWKDYEKKKKESDLPNISYPGSYILQEMLHFRKTDMVTNGILQMSSDELFRIVCDPIGSHVIEAFFSSPFIQDNPRVELYKKLKGKYVAVACSLHGSFIVKHIFNFLNWNMKIELCKELHNSQKLKETRSGGFIYNYFELESFTADGGKIWRNKIENRQNKKLFLTKMRDETKELDTLEGEPPKKKLKESQKLSKTLSKKKKER